jgi:hypothetical protein
MLSQDLRRFGRAIVGGGIIPETPKDVHNIAASTRLIVETESGLISADRQYCWRSSDDAD